MPVHIRAKSVIKLDTGTSHVDHEYPRNAKVEHILKDMLHATVFNLGKAKAAALIADMLDNYPDKEAPRDTPSAQ